MTSAEGSKTPQIGLVHQKRNNGRNSRVFRKKNIVPIVFIGPAIILVTIVMLYPTLHGIWMSLFVSDLFTGATQFVWFGQYVRLFQNPDFFNSLQQSMILTISTVVVAMVFSTGTALILHHMAKSTKGSRFYRMVVLVPWLISGVAVATIWRALFSPQGGLAETIMVSLGLTRIVWFASSFWAMTIVILVSVWSISPFPTLMIYAGLKMVNPELYEAASLDGANAAQTFRFVTVPSISSQLSLAMIFLSIGAINSFDTILLITGGGPGRSTEVLAILLYRIGFQQLDSHAAATLMVVLLVINLLLSFVYIKVLSRD